MSWLIGFLPILLFVLVFVSSGVYFTLTGVKDAFSQLSPLIAILPAIALAWVQHAGNSSAKMVSFINGLRHRDIITMCIIFLLAGAFSEVTKAIGSIEATVNFVLSKAPSEFILIGLFLISSFVSTSIGTSIGTIVAIAPIAAGLSVEGAFPAALGMATVVGGAMFGDNMAIISDTTIAAVMSQEADIKKKVKLNSKIALVASVITIAILFMSTTGKGVIESQAYSFALITPYLFLIFLAVSGVNVFVTIFISILFAWIVGSISHGYDVITFSHDITKGFEKMQEIMLLSLMIGGLSGLIGKSAKGLVHSLSNWISKHGSQRMAQLVTAKLAAIFDILLANNTIAIIFTGKIVREIAKKYQIPPHYSATWLDIFSCVFQGIIPYGAQILLASAAAGISPLSITPYVYYCYVLAIVSILHILFIKVEKE